MVFVEASKKGSPFFGFEQKNFLPDLGVILTVVYIMIIIRSNISETKQLAPFAELKVLYAVSINFSTAGSIKTAVTVMSFYISTIAHWESPWDYSLIVTWNY